MGLNHPRNPPFTWLQVTQLCASVSPSVGDRNARNGFVGDFRSLCVRWGVQNPWHIKAGLSQEPVSSSIVDELLGCLVTAQAQEAQQQTGRGQMTTESDCPSPT